MNRVGFFNTLVLTQPGEDWSLTVAAVAIVLAAADDVFRGVRLRPGKQAAVDWYLERLGSVPIAAILRCVLNAMIAHSPDDRASSSVLGVRLVALGLVFQDNGHYALAHDVFQTVAQYDAVGADILCQAKRFHAASVRALVAGRPLAESSIRVYRPSAPGG
jgi:hypothetical protein